MTKDNIIPPIPTQKPLPPQITLLEFRSWLQGVEDMSTAANWAPNKAQWRKIRIKIDSIKETVIPVSPMSHQFNEEFPINVLPTPQGSALDTVRMPVPAQSIQLTPDAPIGRGQDKVVTPHIDTTDGNYKSSFE